MPPSPQAPHGAVISFFSGLGILDLGFEAAGFRCWMANEIHPPFARAYRYGRETVRQAGGTTDQPVHGVVEGSIGDFFTDAGRAKLDTAMAEARGACGMVGFVGGPPCPDFSIAGKQAGRHGDKGRLTQDYVDLIIAAQPDFFVFENVKGLVSTAAHRAFFEEIKEQLRAGGYALTDMLVNAIWYGAPQDRSRIILVGFRTASFAVDAAEAAARGFDWLGDARWRDALTFGGWPAAETASGGNGGPTVAEAARLSCPDDIQPWRDLTVQAWFNRNGVDTHPNATHHFVPRTGVPRMQTVGEGDTSRKSFKRLHRWRYSPTACYGNNEVHLHPWLDRRLSAAEAMAIQTLPREFELPPDMTLSDMFKTIGNGVPFVLAEALAGATARALAGALATGRVAA